MAKESFNWKSLFINDETDNSEGKAATPPSAPVLPTTDNKFPNQITESFQANSLANPFLNEIFEVYDKGFDSLNEEGFDFFELYKSVMAVGVTNPQSYQMAFAMGKSIKSDLTKDFLLQKGSFYITEIEKVHTKYDTVGKNKKTELDNTITKEKNNLSKSISDLEAKILDLQKELEAKKIELQKIDPVNREQLSEIQLKMEANDLAKQKILSSINTVITGINQYLQ
ncbi:MULTISPECIES: kinetochore protein SPC24 [Flavobacterium]|uniref:kinetochore protein SPC24 n=1 Tax=Flavobacterium TaxID=237 RepID=UPI002114C62B|nr:MULTISPECIES: kinetochore protein SPC24 [Flavobacterium]UUF15606.1 kinetochore protein SPC24 [Flavobacterium panici]